MQLLGSLFNEINYLRQLQLATEDYTIKADAEYVQACLLRPAEVDAFRQLNKNKA